MQQGGGYPLLIGYSAAPRAKAIPLVAAATRATAAGEWILSNIQVNKLSSVYMPSAERILVLFIYQRL